MFEKRMPKPAKKPVREARLSRRHMMQSMLGVSAAAILARTLPREERDELVEINGWILKQSDLA